MQLKRGAQMKYRRFGPTMRDVLVIGQGTWRIEEANPIKAIAALVARFN